MKKKKLVKQGITALLLASMLGTTFIPPISTAAEAIQMLADAAPKPGQYASALTYQLTYVNNSGAARKIYSMQQGAYNRNMLRKEYFTGDASDSTFGKYVGKYIWCVANHTHHPPIGAHPSVVATYDASDVNRPRKRGTDERIDKFNFYVAALYLYYMSKPENRSSLTDKYADVTNYLMAKVAIAAAYEEGALKGEWEFDNMRVNSNLFEIYARDFNPDSVGSTRIYNEIYEKVPAPAELGGGTLDRPIGLLWEMWNNAKTLSELNYDDGGLFGTPVITQGSDGLYHGKVYLTLNNNNSLFLSDLTTEEVYGDWQYKGVGTEDGKAYVEFTSPTGTVPDGGVFAKMKLRPDSSLQAINTDFSKASITQFDFKDKNGAKSGQDMLVADFEGELTVTIKEGGDVPSLPTSEGAVVRYEHEEGFDANYNVNLRKYDSETGKPLENARFDILEAFDDSQLDDTSLDLTEASGYDGSHLGSLISTSWEDGDEISTNYDGDTGLSDSPANLYNWANDNGTQFQRWDGWDYGEGNPSGDSGNDPDSRDNDITADDGLLYTNNTDNTPDKSKPAHYDTKHYEYHKGYCGGHPAPVVEYEELTGEDPPDSEIDAANQAAHDAAWAAWYEEVQKCEQLAEQGGFFHAIEPGIAKAAMEKDRDEFYKDFISLTYDYSAVETNARAGYIEHGTHKDDIPIETRTVTSSELKDYNSGTGIKHQGASSGEDGDADTAEVMLLDAAGNPVSRDRASVATASSAKRNLTENKETAADFVEDEEIEETEEAPKSPDEVVKRTPSIASPSVVKRVYRNTEKIEDNEDFEEEDDEIATPSSYEDEEATPSDAEEEIEASKGGVSLSGLVSDLRAGLSEAVSFISEKVSGAVHAVRSAISRAGGLLRDTESFQKSDASVIDPNKKDIVDWTFIVYDHRTEGELHFNKRDLDLAAQEAGYDSYGDANGDGTLEGAVYGLFAKSDIEHPDGKTGTVYKQNDLVAIATTDRDGNGSFMAYTETPGRTYDYDAGSVVKRTDINWDGPKNLHTDAGESVGLNQDNEKFVGHDRNNNEISINENGGDHGTYYDRLSSNQGIEDTTTEATSGSYPVSDNLHNNGDYWIGRPLILGDYYIKELSRAEGFELSVYGKDAELSNRTAFENGGASVEGSVTVKDAGVSPDYDGTVFTVTSSAIGDAGYDIYLSNLPENIVPSATTYKYEKIQKEQTYQKPVYGTRNVKAVPGEKVIISGKPVAAEVGDKVQLPNGTEKTVNAVSQKEQLYMTVKPANLFASTPAVISVPNGAGKAEFIDEANTILAASYKEPTAAAPWRLVPLSGNNQERSRQINDALSDMTAFNAIRLEDIITQGGTDYAVLRYSYIQYGKESDSLYDEQHKQVLVKKAVSFDGADGFVYAAYDEADLTAVTKNASGFVVSASFKAQKPAKDTVTLYEDLSKLKFVDELSPSYWVYAEGEDRLQNDGSVLTESYIDHYETVTENVTVEEKRESAFPAGQIQYNAAKKAWVLHVDKADIPADGEINFHLRYTPDQTDADGMLRPVYEYADKYVKISASPTMVLTDSYIENPTVVVNPFCNNSGS